MIKTATTVLLAFIFCSGCTVEDSHRSGKIVAGGVVMTTLSDSLPISNQDSFCYTALFLESVNCNNLPANIKIFRHDSLTPHDGSSYLRLMSVSKHKERYIYAYGANLMPSAFPVDITQYSVYKEIAKKSYTVIEEDTIMLSFLDIWISYPDSILRDMSGMDYYAY